MNLQQRIALLTQLGNYLEQNTDAWQAAILAASVKNPWFLPAFCETSAKNIRENFLQKELLEKWAKHYCIDENISKKNVGIVMAGNIPLVGFHDLLCAFITGHMQTIKLSGKDEVLMKHLIQKLIEWEPAVQDNIRMADMLKGCDAYIATGSNNTARYFEQYFGKYPNIIRSNKTSVAIIHGNESAEDLQSLSDDIHLYFGLGCRNVTKIYVPEGYDFLPMLNAFNGYAYFSDFHKYQNNYDFQLSLLLLNNRYYMTNGVTLLVENEPNFSAIGVLNYSFYNKGTNPHLINIDEIQCIVGHGHIPFGKAQEPGLFSYADGVDTMQFLVSIG